MSGGELLSSPLRVWILFFAIIVFLFSIGIAASLITYYCLRNKKHKD